MTLDRIPAGRRVFIDSTIFVYYATGVSEQCRDLLGRCESGEVTGVTSVMVLAEVAHRLMAIEAVASGAIRGTQVGRKLRERPEIVRRLHIYQEHIERIPLMGIDVLSVDTGTVVRSASVRREHGLLVNDSLVVASADTAGISDLASADDDFARVKRLSLYRPTDLTVPPRSGR